MLIMIFEKFVNIIVVFNFCKLVKSSVNIFCMIYNIDENYKMLNGFRNLYVIKMWMLNVKY